MKSHKLFINTVGAVAWALSLQYYIVQAVVAAGWSQSNPFSWARNTISDLANTHCGPYGSRLICSPLHAVMNVSFLVLGTTMILGAYILLNTMAHKLPAKVGFVCMAWAGVGTIFVGLFPENTVSGYHIAGAALAFIFGNVGLLVLGFSLSTIPHWLRMLGVLGGTVGLVALVLFVTHTYLGLGGGTTERICAYPQSIWMTLFGTFVLFNDWRSGYNSRLLSKS